MSCHSCVSRGPDIGRDLELGKTSFLEMQLYVKQQLQP